MLLKILLVIFLRLVERPRRNDLRHNRPLESPRFLLPLFRRPRRRFLLRIMKKYRAAVLRPHIRSLTIRRCRIVARPEPVSYTHLTLPTNREV